MRFVTKETHNSVSLEKLGIIAEALAIVLRTQSELASYVSKQRCICVLVPPRPFFPLDPGAGSHEQDYCSHVTRHPCDSGLSLLLGVLAGLHPLISSLQHSCIRVVSQCAANSVSSSNSMTSFTCSPFVCRYVCAASPHFSALDQSKTPSRRVARYGLFLFVCSTYEP